MSFIQELHAKSQESELSLCLSGSDSHSRIMLVVFKFLVLEKFWNGSLQITSFSVRQNDRFMMRSLSNEKGDSWKMVCFREVNKDKPTIAHARLEIWRQHEMVLHLTYFFGLYPQLWKYLLLKLSGWVQTSEPQKQTVVSFSCFYFVFCLYFLSFIFFRFTVKINIHGDFMLMMVCKLEKQKIVMIFCITTGQRVK
jgi:hypothetical protein